MCKTICWKTSFKMVFKVLLNILLVLISTFGFLFAFVAAGSLMTFLSYIPSPKVNVSEVHCKWNISDVLCVQNGLCDRVDDLRASKRRWNSLKQLKYDDLFIIQHLSTCILSKYKSLAYFILLNSGSFIYVEISTVFSKSCTDYISVSLYM